MLDGNMDDGSKKRKLKYDDRMDPQLVTLDIDANGIARITLNDPDRRNALGLAMFDALQRIIETVRDDDAVRIVLLHGRGAVFCAGFDLGAAVEDPSLMGAYISRLSEVNRMLRRLGQVVVVAVQGAAIAGGCALLSAGDFVFISHEAKVGYPVHRLGVSPAVTIPTLQQAIGAGAARTLLMSGHLIDGTEAHRIGLASHVIDSDEALLEAALEFCRFLALKPPGGMRITKAWLNELDGSLDENRFNLPAAGSIGLTSDEESRNLLREYWKSR